jgi:hypothetical protein
MRYVTAFAVALVLAGCGSATNTATITATKTISGAGRVYRSGERGAAEAPGTQREASKESCSAMYARITAELKRAKERTVGKPALELNAIRLARAQLARYQERCQPLR